MSAECLVCELDEAIIRYEQDRAVCSRQDRVEALKGGLD